LGKKNITIKGVGYIYLENEVADDNGDKKDLRIGRLQNLNFALETTTEDVFGGDDLFPFDEVVTGKNATVTATAAEFDLGMVEFTQGSPTVTEDTEIYVFEEGTVIGADDYSLKHGTDLVTGSLKVWFKDGEELDVGDTTPTAGEYTVAGGKLTFATADEGKEVLIDYKYKVTDASVNHVLTDSIAKPVKIVHVANFQAADGTEGGLQTIVYRARAQGTFNIDFARATASTHNLEIKMLDPGRADKKMISFARF